MLPIRIFTTPICGYCVMAKRLLDREGLEYEEINASSDPEIRQWLVQATGQRTVPQIFFGEESIGGYQELVAIERTEGLRTRLAKT